MKELVTSILFSFFSVKYHTNIVGDALEMSKTICQFQLASITLNSGKKWWDIIMHLKSIYGATERDEMALANIIICFTGKYH